MYQLNICHLYPDLLNLYGDRGNIIALKKRAEWRGIEVNIHSISIGDPFQPELYDIIFLGGGQDFEQDILQDDILHQKGKEIISAIQHNKLFLCICGGYQMLGNYYKTWKGAEISFLGALDLWTIGGEQRFIGNFVFECDFLQKDGFDGRVVGFENHSGRTYLGPSVSPLGKVIKGHGNNGEDGFEGALYRNVFCSYSHGSLLPKNPKLTDHLLTIALKQKYKEFVSLQNIHSELENVARMTVIKRIL